ncbi:hypothetical protein SH668x_000301 [Planctomicrobium sp. SH668]|uniref:hypothetical protein n=1 Tax=Planctomicrobium sp. SH668 TaxID=3448126 RepID=UPI003F5C1F6F
MDKAQVNQGSSVSDRNVQRAAGTAAQGQVNIVDDTLCYLKEYAREKPEVAALWCFGIGFIVGWKMKPW